MEPQEHAELHNAPTKAAHAPKRGIIMRMRNRITTFRKRDDGVAAVEFAMIMAPFFALLLAIFEVGIHYFVETTLQSGVDTVARQVRTGEIRPGSAVQAEFKQALCNESADGILFLFDCNKMKFDITTLAGFGPGGGPPRKPDGSVDDSGFGVAPGGRSSVNLVRVYYEWPAFLNWTKFGVEAQEWKRNTRLMEGVAMFQNEPY